MRQQLGAGGQLEAFAMPVIDMRRPVGEKRTPRLGRSDRVIADLGQALRVERDFGAEMLGEHLRAEADAEERPLLPQRHFDPVDLARDIIVAVIGAHRAAEDHRAGMGIQRFRQRIAEARPANVERMAERTQGVADAARRRVLLMQHDQHRTGALHMHGFASAREGHDIA